jgi:2-hydroxychromene-2-carboxylate isomerase
MPTPAAFYFDLASPLAYLAAERVLQVLPAPAEWTPVLARELPGADTFDAFRCQQEHDISCAELARRAEQLGLQPLRWPDPFPFDSALAMRVATYAKSIGRAVPFAQAAFRQAFAGGRSLADPDNVLIAAAACEMHPAAVLNAAEQKSVAERLVAATAQAARAGVTDVPAVVIGGTQAGDLGRVFTGERCLEEAAALVRGGQHAHCRSGGQCGSSRADPNCGGAVKAKHAYRLIVTRGGLAPALLADAARVDHVEVVEVDSGEVVLFWDQTPQAASKRSRELREDLAQLDAEEFIARWSTVEH